MKIIKILTLIFFALLLGSNDTFGQNTSTTNSKVVAQASIKTVELNVDGMTCQKGCADGIDRKFKNVSGVVKSKTTLDNGTSIVTYDENKIKIPQLISIIEARGYTAKVAVKNK